MCNCCCNILTCSACRGTGSVLIRYPNYNWHLPPFGCGEYWQTCQRCSGYGYVTIPCRHPRPAPALPYPAVPGFRFSGSAKRDVEAARS
jgi:hypothetical protein